MTEHFKAIFTAALCILFFTFDSFTLCWELPLQQIEEALVIFWLFMIIIHEKKNNAKDGLSLVQNEWVEKMWITRPF